MLSARQAGLFPGVPVSVPTFMIGLREGLEASLVVSILIAYLVKTGRRNRVPAVWAGVAVAIAISLAFGAGLEFTSANMTFEAQEAFGGTMSIVAVALVTWMIFWMRRAARSIKGELQGKVDRALAMGTTALVITAFIAVAREGLETALFIWSTANSTDTSGSSPIVGAVVGLLVAAALGYLLYRGAIQINLATFFTWTGGFLVVIAAGVLAYGIHDFQEANILPGLDDIAIDLSSFYYSYELVGTLLKGIFNISAQMTKLETAAWLLYVIPVMFFFLRRPKAEPAPGSQPKAPVAAG